MRSNFFKCNGKLMRRFRPDSDSLGNRHRFRRDEAHCCTHRGRHDPRMNALLMPSEIVAPISAVGHALAMAFTKPAQYLAPRGCRL